MKLDIFILKYIHGMDLTLTWPWCWEGLGAGGEGDDRGWDGWMASLTRWAWVWVNFGSWWSTGRPGVLRFMESQRVGQDWATELNWTELNFPLFFSLPTRIWGVAGGGARKVISKYILQWPLLARKLEVNSRLSASVMVSPPEEFFDNEGKDSLDIFSFFLTTGQIELEF